ncbi:MAG: NUDIX domain-containing protein [Nanoarchaeota archaeon]
MDEKDDKKVLVKVRAIILYEGKLLVVRHSRTKFLALPGGHLEYGEDLKECLSREIIEELGVKPEIGRLFYVNIFTEKNDTQYLEFFFEIKNGVDYLDIEKLARSHAHEIDEIFWASPTDDINILPKVLANDFKTGKMFSDEIKYIKD